MFMYQVDWKNSYLHFCNIIMYYFLLNDEFLLKALFLPMDHHHIGGDFGKGAIDLGGLEVYEALYFKKIWDTHSGGPKGLGASFYEPTSIPSGFNLIGHYCKPNSIAMFATVLMAKDTKGDPSQGALKSPKEYTLIWTSKGLNVAHYKTKR
ncbi:putative vacuolar protein sorting-associated protein [Helianthus annuus]|uniref:Vacuolar protein sorting-associated protein n=1 Tax=Helianthus annuus TaxID=4232 RepID=A0A9K3J144_HELAN|nr:putative vacuolar protein sorting-associated protein [Helianthus annuus]KAJ0585330.1 putative vacuolar protein sorting-associated protein [Helianthus annuus]KAJ0919846.1 putative vacuolar protein sorting-associated protein [Helianthus annuus]